MAVFVVDVGTTLSSFNEHHVNCFKVIRFCLSFLEKNYLGQRNLVYPCQFFSYKTQTENCRKAALCSLIFAVGSFL